MPYGSCVNVVRCVGVDGWRRSHRRRGCRGDCLCAVLRRDHWCASVWARTVAPKREPEPQTNAPPLGHELATQPTCTRRIGALGTGNDAAAPELGHTLATAVARCAAVGAVGFTFCARSDEADRMATLPLCYFKTSTDGVLPPSARLSVQATYMIAWLSQTTATIDQYDATVVFR